jgi:hypothetical protein
MNAEGVHAYGGQRNATTSALNENGDAYDVEITDYH